MGKIKYIRTFILLTIILAFTLIMPTKHFYDNRFLLAHAKELTTNHFRWLPKPEKYSSNLSHQDPPHVEIESDFLPQSESEVIDVINNHRINQGLSAVEFNEQLQMAARIRSKEMFDNNYFEHQRPNGKRWYNVLNKDINFEYLSAGENIAVMDTEIQYPCSPFEAEEWYESWKESPTHYETMMDSNFTYIGAGVYQGIKDGKYYAYATTIFVKI